MWTNRAVTSFTGDLAARSKHGVGLVATCSAVDHAEAVASILFLDWLAQSHVLVIHPGFGLTSPVDPSTLLLLET